ncbi:MAG: hypothetical protein HOV67_31650 [Kribbellaceae bacterium]|nr:hypothetical protein [Kribbellaceae bacterium]
MVLAEDLVAAGFAGEATVDVAVLRRDTARRDAESLVRNMLAECGIEVPVPGDEDAEYRLLLRAFGFWDLPISDCGPPFLRQLRSWDQQDDLERTLIRLFGEFDHATGPTPKHEIVQRMRAVVRDALA